MDLIDTHCHLDLDAFDADRDSVLENCRAVGVKHLLVPAIDRDHWRPVIDLCQREPGLVPALGLHPFFMANHRAQHLSELATTIETDPPAAVGEIGLDYLVADTDREAQQDLFSAQLDIAGRYHLPVVLHVRKAHDDVISLLKSHPVRGGFVHAFNGSMQQAGKYIDMGFKLGFGGMLTYAHSRRLRELAAGLPAEALVLETDAPDMTVASHQGRRNSPEYLHEVLAALAEVRGTPLEQLAEQTSANARQVVDFN